MDEKSEVEKIDEVMLPGFRFHPTDEELVGFYLKRKIQQRTLSIELIKQLDIYKYDPWDLPKMATTGEKEWYFYCPRDRKYRNSARPNRVTGAGFWKATGTDRPIYSSEGNKCIGLKKSLVFYKGRAAKGIKTDWMMHEFRLPSLTDSGTPKRFINDKTIPANESWAICRIFKKTSSTTLRVTSQSWVSTLAEPVSSNHIPSKCCQATHLNSQSMIMTAENSSGMHLNYNNDHIEQTSTVNPLAFSYHKPINPFPCKPSQLPISNCDLTSNFLLSPLETSAPAKCTVDFSSILLNMSSSMLGDYGKVGESIGLDDSQEHCNNGFSLDILPQEMQLGMSNGDETVSLKSSNMAHMDSEWEIARNIGFPFSSQMNMTNIGAWKPSMVWDSLPFPTEVSASFSTAKCYT